MGRKKTTTTDRLKVSELPEEKPVIIPEETPEEKPEETPEEKPEETPEEKPEETPEKKPEETPEEKPEEKPADSFNELYEKIGKAEAPPIQSEVKKPLIENTGKRKKRGESSPDSFRIEGYLLLLVVDTVFPFSFAFLNNMLDKKLRITADQLKLTDKQTKELSPLADQAADYMKININPIAGFTLMAFFMYGNNLLTIRMFAENAKVNNVVKQAA